MTPGHGFVFRDPAEVRALDGKVHALADPVIWRMYASAARDAIGYLRIQERPVPPMLEELAELCDRAARIAP